LSVESGIEVLGTRVHRVPDRYRVALVIEGGDSRGMFSAACASASKNSGLSRFSMRCTARAAGLRGKRVVGDLLGGRSGLVEM
jgi:hypothetical protein